MSAAKIAISVDRRLLATVDRWVAQGRFPNRSQAIQAALRDVQDRWKRTRLSAELGKLDPAEERALADERLAGETWRG